MTLTSGNGTAYEIHGPADRPALVLIHGLGLTRDTWADHVGELSKGYRVLAYDLFGHGESALPPSTPTVTLFSEQLDQLMEELGIGQAVIIGFSLGGMINRRFAMDHPDKVAALVVLNSPHDRGVQAQRLVEQRAADADAGGPAATLDAAIERWFTEAFRNSHPDVIGKIRSWLLANDPKSYADSRMVLAVGVKELIRPDPPISHPTLVMTCENDTGSTPKMSRDIAAEIDGAQTIIVPGLKHMGLVERPDLFTGPILEFVAKQVV